MNYGFGRYGWWAMSGDAKRRVIRTVGKVGAEFEAVQRLSRTLADYRNIFAPTRLIAGERTRHAARLIVDELLTLLPDAQLSVVARAGHMSPVTHPDAIVAVIEKHVDTHQGAPKPALSADATRPALSYTAGPLRPTRFEHAG